jgi:hypothetical protein
MVICKFLVRLSLGKILIFTRAAGFIGQLACTQFTSSNVAQYHAFFGHTPEQQRSWTASMEMDVPGLKAIKVDGICKRIKGYQHFAAWWMLTHESQYGHGGTNGDEPGFGKTLTLVFTTVLAFLIEENKREVKRFLAGEATPDHLKPDETGKCERGKFFGFACCCEQESLAAKLNIVPAATLVITLGSVLPTWEQEFQNWVDRDVAPLRVVILHNSSSGLTKEDLIKYKVAGPDLSKSKLVRADLPLTHNSNWTSAIESITDKMQQTNQHDLVLITTWNTASTRVFKQQLFNIRSTGQSVKYVCNDKTRCPQGGGSCKSASHNIVNKQEHQVPSIEYGRVLIDESHLMKNSGHSFITGLKARLTLQQRWFGTKFSLWAVSGTPMTGGPSDLHIWYEFNNKNMAAKFKAHAKTFQELIDKRDLQDEERQHLKDAYSFIEMRMRAHMIRRDNETRDTNERPLVDLPKLDTKIIDVDVTDTTSLDDWFRTEQTSYRDPEKTKGSNLDRKACRSYRLSRMFINFGHLSKMGAPDYASHSSNAIAKNRWYSRDSPYKENIDKLYHSSDKFQILVDKVIMQLEPRPRFKNGKLDEKLTTRAKLIVCSADPTCTHVLYEVIGFR